MTLDTSMLGVPGIIAPPRNYCKNSAIVCVLAYILIRFDLEKF